MECFSFRPDLHCTIFIFIGLFNVKFTSYWVFFIGIHSHMPIFQQQTLLLFAVYFRFVSFCPKPNKKYAPILTFSAISLCDWIIYMLCVAFPRIRFAIFCHFSTIFNKIHIPKLTAIAAAAGGDDDFERFSNDLLVCDPTKTYRAVQQSEVTIKNRLWFILCPERCHLLRQFQFLLKLRNIRTNTIRFDGVNCSSRLH